MIPNGPYKSIGRIEFCINGTWGTICSDFFDDNDAMVLCRQLGYSTLGNKELNYVCVVIIISIAHQVLNQWVMSVVRVCFHFI